MLAADDVRDAWGRLGFEDIPPLVVVSCRNASAAITADAIETAMIERGERVGGPYEAASAAALIRHLIDSSGVGHLGHEALIAMAHIRRGDLRLCEIPQTSISNGSRGQALVTHALTHLTHWSRLVMYADALIRFGLPETITAGFNKELDDLAAGKRTKLGDWRSFPTWGTKKTRVDFDHWGWTGERFAPASENPGLDALIDRARTRFTREGTCANWRCLAPSTQIVDDGPLNGAARSSLRGFCEEHLTETGGRVVAAL